MHSKHELDSVTDVAPEGVGGPPEDEAPDWQLTGRFMEALKARHLLARFHTARRRRTQAACVAVEQGALS
jgi:hypothetical protein